MRCHMLLSRAVAVALLVLPLPAFAEEDGLAAVNRVARAAYADGRAALLARTSPIIVAAFDRLIVLRNGEQSEAPFTPPVYHQLKTIAHVPLGIVTLLLAEAETAGDGSWRARLAELRDRAGAAGTTIDALGLSAEQAARQHRILNQSIAFIGAVERNGRPDTTAIQTFARSVSPDVLANAADAAQAQLDGLHAAVQRIRSELSAAEWARSFVLVLGGKQPRVGNLQFEYFVNAVDGQADRRVIYAEGIFEPKQAVALLATILIDREIGTAFFNDDRRMERDLLSDAARAYVPRLLGRSGR
jgi:hypothetical protein